MSAMRSLVERFVAKGPVQEAKEGWICCGYCGQGLSLTHVHHPIRELDRHRENCLWAEAVRAIGADPDRLREEAEKRKADEPFESAMRLALGKEYKPI